MEVVWTPSWIHSLLLMVMILLILTGRRNGVHESRRKVKQECQGLRAALTAEFMALRGVHRINLDLVAAGAPTLISGRPHFSVYRGNMHRLMWLTKPEITAIVTAFAASELLDASVSISQRMRARHLDTATWNARRLDQRRLHRAARAAVEEALEALDEAARAAARTPPAAELPRALWARLRRTMSRPAAPLHTAEI